ncbi:hypothetical protein EI42_03642 [Thermosporothrix hazakensis]|uniref:Uncharacterized protein n=1 Tax=Thermosporothrix hazakensis TaxID=644383 RepID=A0A326U3T0_THEHA|nr:hypothetical protein [Thermosporothrix hazakensis]PZW27079.1 hypothetical protein EI42_03642 [Thermosporothrix hazakensis]GCE50364.1 hypothetical protein KTH_52330 [Thermosporothrix hazakensis]
MAGNGSEYRNDKRGRQWGESLVHRRTQTAPQQLLADLEEYYAPIEDDQALTRVWQRFEELRAQRYEAARATGKIILFPRRGELAVPAKRLPHLGIAALVATLLCVGGGIAYMAFKREGIQRAAC